MKGKIRGVVIMRECTAFWHGGVTCESCNEDGLVQETISLEDFAKLFEWGTDIIFTGLDRAEGRKQVIRVAPNESEEPR